MNGNTVIKSPQKASVIQPSPIYSSQKFKMESVKSENDENTTISRCEKDPSNEQQYIPSTSGSGMQIITNKPHFVLHAHPSLCTMAMKLQTVARL